MGLKVGVVELGSQEAARHLSAACQTLGLFYLRGHGLEGEFLASVLRAARALFGTGIPPEQRTRVVHHGGGFLRGYIEQGAESGSSTSLEASKEGFSLGYESTQAEKAQPQEDQQQLQQLGGASGDTGKASGESLNPRVEAPWPLEGPNVWPPSLETKHRAALQRFFRECWRVSQALVGLMAQCPGLESAGEALSAALEGGERMSLLRVFHYVAGHRNSVGSSPHTDWGLWTIILQDPHVSGLQLWHQEQWVFVPPVADALVVNVGDLLHLLSGKAWTSPLHRVVAETDEERFSLVFFQYPRYDTPLPPAALTPDPEGRAGGISLLKFQGKQGHPQADKCEAAEAELGPGASPKGNSASSFGDVILRKWAQVQRAQYGD